MQRLLAFGALILLFVVFSIASPYFFSFDNIIGIFLATAVNGLLALGVTFVIITGGIDLSIGTVMTLCSVMAGVFVTFWGLSVPLGVLAGLATGALCGVTNGLIIAKLKMPPLYHLAWRGQSLSLVISGRSPFISTPCLPDAVDGFDYRRYSRT
jgi:ribose transport system permease protein